MPDHEDEAFDRDRPAPPTFAVALAELSRQHFADTQIGHHTPIWNALKAFEAKVVELHETHARPA